MTEAQKQKRQRAKKSSSKEPAQNTQSSISASEQELPTESEYNAFIESLQFIDVRLVQLNAQAFTAKPESDLVGVNVNLGTQVKIDENNPQRFTVFVKGEIDYVNREDADNTFGDITIVLNLAYEPK